MNPKFPPSWSVVSLHDLGEVNRGRSRHRPRYAEHLYGGPYPFIQTGDIKASGGRITTFTQTYSEAGLSQSRIWPVGTMCITIAANIAETAILTFPACFPDSVVGFIADESKADVRFVEYMFRLLRAGLQGQAGGTAQDNINIETLQRLKFGIPPLPEQRRIAHILGTLDDKIELNRRMNATLEAMARALFQSWFVDFDPVRAKAAGRTPAGMDPATADLFPSEFEDSALGEIPKGWEVVQLASVCKSISSGGTPSTKEPTYWNGDVPWLSSGETRSTFIIDTEKTITKAGVENSSTRKARAGCTVIASAGQGHTRGQASLLTFESYVNQSVVVVEADGERCTDAFAFLDTSRRYEQFRQLSDSHSSRGSLTTKLIGGISITLPPKPAMLKFEEAVSCLIACAVGNLRQSRTLATLRDTLLPKLLAGEISSQLVTEIST